MGVPNLLYHPGGRLGSVFVTLCTQCLCVLFVVVSRRCCFGMARLIVLFVFIFPLFIFEFFLCVHFPVLVVCLFMFFKRVL